MTRRLFALKLPSTLTMAVVHKAAAEEAMQLPASDLIHCCTCECECCPGLFAGLEAATNSNCTEQQQQAQQLQQLASSQHMLQQQLLALTNHVDPAAAAQLAAAAAGDESALTFQPLGPLASGSGSLLSNTVFDGTGGLGAWEEAWASSSYLQACSQPGAAGNEVVGT